MVSRFYQKLKNVSSEYGRLNELYTGQTDFIQGSRQKAVNRSHSAPPRGTAEYT